MESLAAPAAAALPSSRDVGQGLPRSVSKRFILRTSTPSPQPATTPYFSDATFNKLAVGHLVGVTKNVAVAKQACEEHSRRHPKSAIRWSSDSKRSKIREASIGCTVKVIRLDDKDHSVKIQLDDLRETWWPVVRKRRLPAHAFASVVKCW